MDEKLKKEKEELEKKLEKARAEKNEALAQFAEEKQKQKKEAAGQASNAFCETQLREGYVTPAHIKAGLPELLIFADLSAETTVINFGEEERKPGDILRDIFSQVKILDFEEQAKSEPLEKSDIEKFGEKAKEMGVTIGEYKEAEKKVEGFDLTPEAYIKANPHEFASLGGER